MLRPFIVTAILLTVSITGLYTVAGSIAAAREGRQQRFRNALRLCSNPRLSLLALLVGEALNMAASIVAFMEGA
jgi:hypothetical protein